MGAFADDVNERLRDGLASRIPAFTWATEHRVAGTPVDVGGVADDRFVAVELEWRRADPADNAAKLFRHVAEDEVGADRIHVVHLFTRYYDLVSGGVSAKRANAEFVGRTAAEQVPALSYHPRTLDVAPPKRGGERPDGWRDAVDEAVAAVAELVGDR